MAHGTELVVGRPEITGENIFQNAPTPQAPSIQEMQAATAEPQQAEEKDDFDGAAFLSDHGLTLKDVGDKQGTIHVADSFGNEQAINLNEMMAKEGINPQSVNLLLNTPDTAVNKSPVGFGDRIRLALGNAKGQLNYLKANYQDAVLGEDGQLKVKDKGAWYNVDPRGLGDGNGWDMAGELVKDFADLTDIGIQGIAQLGGAALAGIPSAGAGSLAGAAAGAAFGKGITTALGRILNTYDATPQEQLRDVGIDAVIGMAGQGIALGAKAAITKTFGAALSKLGNEASPAVQDAAANLLSTTTGMPRTQAFRNVTRSDYVSPIVDSILEKGNAPRALVTSGDPLNATVLSTVMPGSQEAFEQAAVQETRGAAKALLESAQPRLSAQYRAGMDAAEFAQKGIDLPLSEPVAKFQGELFKRAGNAISVTDAGQHVVDARQLGVRLGLPEISAEPIAEAVQKVSNAARQLGQNLGDNVPGRAFGAESQFKRATKLTQQIDDLVYSTLEQHPDNPNIQQFLGGMASDFKNNILNGMTPEARLQFTSTSAHYARNKPAVEMAQKALQDEFNGKAGIDGVVKKLMGSDVAGVEKQQARFLQLANLMGGEGGQAAIDRLQDTIAANARIAALPKAVTGGGPIATGVRAIGAVTGISSPTNQVNATVKGVNLLGKTFRMMSEAQRKAALQDPAKLGALISAAIGQ